MLVANMYMTQYTNCLFCLLKKNQNELNCTDSFRINAEQYCYSTKLWQFSFFNSAQGKKIPGQTRDHDSLSHKMSCGANVPGTYAPKYVLNKLKLGRALNFSRALSLICRTLSVVRSNFAAISSREREWSSPIPKK